jgi:heterodisulfide reductase subunit B
MKVAYYPGCSLEGSAIDYAESIQGICHALNVDLEEVPQWTCCGATAAHSIDHRASIELAGRNLNLAARMPHTDMLVPCPMCFNRLKTASCALQGDQQSRYQIKLPASVPKITDLANFFATEKMLEMTAHRIQKRLEGLRVVCYYGCMANRPPEITEASDFEDPQAMDRIIANLGGTTIDWPFKTDCCGATQVLSRQDIVTKLVGKLFDMAQRVGAQAVVVSCQMCQANLDMFQARVGSNQDKPSALPVYYFSELIGLALELKGVRKSLSRHITDPLPLLQELGLEPR